MTLSRCVTVVCSTFRRLFARDGEDPAVQRRGTADLDLRAAQAQQERGQVDQIGLAERHVAEQVGQRRRSEQAHRPYRVAIGQDGQALEDVVDLPQRYRQPQPAIVLDRGPVAEIAHPAGRQQHALEHRFGRGGRPGKPDPGRGQQDGRGENGGRCAWEGVASRLPCSVQNPRNMLHEAAPVSPVTPAPAQGDALERLLLVHEHAEGWLDRLRRRFPDLEVEVCARPDRLPGLLATFRPTMAYSCKTAGIPGPAHRPLLDCPTLRWLHVGGSGYDHLAGWETRPLLLTNSRGVLAPFLAEAVMAALLALSFGLPRFLRQQQAGVLAEEPVAPAGRPDPGDSWAPVRWAARSLGWRGRSGCGPSGSTGP